MKVLTDKELMDAPHVVQFVYLASISEMPVGSGIIDEAMNGYPEYFPDEFERKRKYALVPEEVHDQYYSEISELSKELYKDLPPNPAIFSKNYNPSECKNWSDALKVINSISVVKQKEIHQKYYSKYGV